MEDVKFCINFTNTMQEKIKKLARKKKTSMNELVVYMIFQKIDEYERKVYK